MSDSFEMALNTSNVKMLQNLQHEREYGSATRAPFLTQIAIFPQWRTRFINWIEGTDPKMLSYLEGGYTRPKGENNLDLLYEEMQDEDKKKYEIERKAYVHLTSALPHEILFQFERFRTASTLWSAIEAEYSGNDEMRKMQGQEYQREFDNFCSFRNESLNDTVERYWKLLSQLSSFDIIPSQAACVEQLANALPEKWGPYLMVQRKTNSMKGITVTDFVQQLRQEEMLEKRRAKQQRYAQETSSPSPHVPLRTSGFVTKTSTSVPSAPASFPTPSGSSTPSSSSAAGINLSGMHTENISKSSKEDIQSKMELLTTLVNSYDDLLAGNIGNANLDKEDYDQIDEDEVELMDIMWGMANLVRRADRFTARTGRKVRITRGQKFGFNMDAVTCYNCGKRGHFARQCSEPKRNGPQSPFYKLQNHETVDSQPSVPRSSTPTSQALKVVHDDEGTNQCRSVYQFGNT